MSDTKRTIVLVEDDDGLRTALQRLLKLAGFNALVYNSAEALKAANVINQAWCLILDVQLPGVSGPTMYERLPEPRPPVVFITSHDNLITRRAVEIAGGELLVKPFAGTRLLDVIAMAGKN
ncbi:response regulator [Paraburkholderia sp. SIMBA_055]|jgi:FixJ family two-component response regulator